jgi:hypothetical protein
MQKNRGDPFLTTLLSGEINMDAELFKQLLIAAIHKDASDRVVAT